MPDQPESASVEIEQLFGHFPLLGFPLTAFLVASMPKRAAAFAAHSINYFLYAGRRQAFVHFLNEIFLYRIGIEMQHRHERAAGTALFCSLQKAWNVRFVVTRNNWSDA